jgi:hypothetical protein
MTTKRTMNQPSLPAKTRVLNTTDSEPGAILNGFTFDPSAGEWTEYEAVTQYGIERWQRSDFILFSEM